MSTAAYDTAPHRAAPRQAAPRPAPPRQATPYDDSWLDSWEAGRDPGQPDPQGSVPGYFAPRIYRGRSVDELIPTIVAELGEDAVVIRHHRGLTGGFAGFFQKSFVEIEARRGDPGGSLLDRYDEDDPAPALPGDAASALPSGVAPALPDEFEDDRAPVAPPKPLNWDGPTEVWATNPFAAALAEAEAAVRAAEPAVPPDLDAALAEALAEAEDAEAPEEIVAAPLPDLDVEPVATAPPAAAAVVLPPEYTDALDHYPTPPSTEPTARDEVEHALGAIGIGEEFVQELIEAAIAHVLPLMPPSTGLAQAVHTALAQRIPASRPLPAKGAAIAVIGAGGSGKSACCAALVEAYREYSTLPATCLTVLPGAMPNESALSGARTGGVLLLDTPTVSGADPGSISALAQLLEQLRPERVVLALPATLGATPAAQLLQALGPLHPDALAITHADETDQLGVAVQTACTFGLAPIHLLARAEHVRSEAVPGPHIPIAPTAWALTWIDPFLLADRLLAPRCS
jgi:flagellar biosynthesis protein FlhF